MTDALQVWAIYDHPTDYPNTFVARKHLAVDGASHPTDAVIVAPDLEACRREVLRVAPGAMRLPRFPEDDPCIVGVWL